MSFDNSNAKRIAAALNKSTDLVREEEIGKREEISSDNRTIPRQEKTSKVVSTPQTEVSLSPNSEANTNYIKREKTKAWTFSLTNTARSNLTELAQEAGYSSSSKFLNDLFTKYKDDIYQINIR